jgi:hypothetical protein
LPNWAHRYAATGEMLRWDDVFSLLDRLTGRHIRRITVGGWLLRAAGSAGDGVKRIYDFNFRCRAKPWNSLHAGPAQTPDAPWKIAV